MFGLTGLASILSSHSLEFEFHKYTFDSSSQELAYDADEQ